MRAPAGGAAGVRRWSQSAPAPLTDYAGRAKPHHPYPVFPYDDQINQRFAIWQGDISTLDVDAITNTTDETLSECNVVSERIMQGAGPDLKEEIITRGLECRTGEVVVTGGFGLPCRHVIHTVSPKYVPKYHGAAETALHNCYKSVLHRARELGARSLALCPITASRKNFPPDLAAHTALRTVRRYLEQNAYPQLVVLCCPSLPPAAGPLRALAPLYFPRDAREADAARWRLRDAGGAEGGPAHPERTIRIIHNPHTHTDNAEDDTSLDDEAAAEAAAALARACSPDTQLLLPATQLPHQQHHTRYHTDQSIPLYSNIFAGRKCDPLVSVHTLIL